MVKGHFWVPKILILKMEPSAQPIIAISKAEHLTVFWYRGLGGTRKWPILKVSSLPRQAGIINQFIRCLANSSFIINNSSMYLHGNLEFYDSQEGNTRSSYGSPAHWMCYLVHLVKNLHEENINIFIQCVCFLNGKICNTCHMFFILFNLTSSLRHMHMYHNFLLYVW